ncbi:MAG: helix-turn-helix domain-containing protein [Pseudomonadota bacterium]
MPFERQFDEARVLDSAMRVFWARGYQATSVSDLVEATGLHRGSLYAAYSDKRGVFRAALSHYDRVHRELFLAGIARRHRACAAILKTFDEAGRPSEETGAPSGCLLVNTALELSPHEPEIRALVQESLGAVEAFFAERLSEAQADASIPAAVCVETRAKALLGLFLGLRVATRAGSDPSVIKAIKDQAAAMLT